MASTTGSSETSKPIVIAIVYYSLYGHIAGLAKAIKAGAESYSSDIKVKLYQVPETLSEDINKNACTTKRFINSNYY